MKTQPPNLPDEVLFRSLLAVPRPRRLLKFRIKESKARLYVQALGSHEMPTEVTGARFDIQVLSKCLVLESGKPAFSSPEGLANCLTMRELDLLSRECLAAMSEISPMLTYCDYKLWSAKLEAGANHPANFIITNALGSCFGMIVLPDKSLTQDYPERYFGVTRSQLLDCHWMAYWAARKVYSNNVFGKPDEKQFFDGMQSGGLNVNRDK